MSQSLNEISKRFKETLDKHGHTFHHSILRRVEELQRQDLTKWGLVGSEYPVENKGNNSHIDFVLKHFRGFTYLIAECKKADPARANWCFVKTPYNWRDERETYIQIDKIVDSKLQNGSISRKLTTTLAPTRRNIMNLGVEVKTGQTGDGFPSPDKSPINAAISQVLRNTSGLLNTFYNSDFSLKDAGTNPFRFIPVVFTTAQIWVSNVDLGTGNINDGTLPNNDIEAENVDWIWFNYNRPNLLSPEIELSQNSKISLSDEYYQFLRTVAIVSPSGIDSFFKTDLNEWLSMSDF